MKLPKQAFSMKIPQKRYFSNLWSTDSFSPPPIAATVNREGIVP